MYRGEPRLYLADFSIQPKEGRTHKEAYDEICKKLSEIFPQIVKMYDEIGPSQIRCIYVFKPGIPLPYPLSEIRKPETVSKILKFYFGEKRDESKICWIIAPIFPDVEEDELERVLQQIGEYVKKNPKIGYTIVTKTSREKQKFHMKMYIDTEEDMDKFRKEFLPLCSLNNKTVLLPGPPILAVEHKEVEKWDDELKHLMYETF